MYFFVTVWNTNLKNKTTTNYQMIMVKCWNTLIATALLLIAISCDGRSVPSLNKHTNYLTTSGNTFTLLNIRGGANNAKKVIAVATPKELITTTEGASIPNEVFNLVKGIVGVGVLSLPAGEFVTV